MRFYRVYGRFSEPVRFRGYTGFMVRGVIGASLRSLYCVRGGGFKCQDCELILDCPYGFLFELSSRCVAPLDFKPKSCSVGVSRPYTVEPLNVKSGVYLFFGFNVFGWRTLRFEIPIVLGLASTGNHGLGGRRVKFTIDRISVYDPYYGEEWDVHTKTYGFKYQREPVKYDVMDYVWRKARVILESEPQELTIEFLTPTKIRTSGRTRYDTSFRSLLAAIARRYTILSLYYDFGKPLSTLEVKRLLTKAPSFTELYRVDVRVWRLSKYSIEYECKRYLGEYITGKLTYKINKVFWKTSESELAAKLLVLGELFNIGNMASAGLGKYRIHITV